jgi:ribonuclease Y
LASELGLTTKSREEGGFDIFTARRSGLLHDLGKAMDHELDGGHAVIGAKFIEDRGEDPIVVHAVRAHHYDIEPTRPLDYLVIGADAISGARPGARRSTMESYSQKLIALDGIARSFKGVTDCFVLNGGRECRVLVDSRKVSDQDALQLSQKIAKKIEEECNYPGQIKIVVIRETLAAFSTGKS